MHATARSVPSYRHHKPTGQAVVTLNEKDLYLGKYGTPESKEAYNRQIAEWLSNNRQLTPQADPSCLLSVSQVALAFWKHAEVYYRKPDGTQTSEVDNYRQALRPLKKLYGTTPAAHFGPKSLKAVREEMIREGWCRTNINKQVDRIRAIFKWAVAQEMIPPTVYHGLQAVVGLKRGRCEAKESEPKRPVPDAYVEAVQPFVNRQVWALIQLQLLTGARAGELLTMRPVDLDMSGDVWVYSLAEHKTAHHGHERTIYLGSRAQDVIRPFLSGRPVTAYLFSPAEAEQERHAEQREQRKTPVQPSQIVRAEKASQRQRRRPPGSRYDTEGYRRAIARACKKADEAAHEKNKEVPAEQVLVPCWHPHRLRHNAGTNIRRQFGIELARVVLGHRSAAITEIYAEADHQKAQEIMRKIG